MGEHKTENPCITVGCSAYDEEFGCTMPSINMCYGCKLVTQTKPPVEITEDCLECEYFDDCNGCTAQGVCP